MKFRLIFTLILGLSISVLSCNNKDNSSDLNIVFLHHSTGEIIWNGAPPNIIQRVAKKISDRFENVISKNAMLPSLISKHNKENSTHYSIKAIEFPKIKPYGWNNNPYDYYNIWVKHAGKEPYLKEPTLEILTEEYQVIIFKHCFPVSNIQADKDSSDINSNYRSLTNYQLQYLALREKMNSFPETKFILFTGAAQVRSNIKVDEAERAKEFFNWVINEWDIQNDNVYVWDLYELETEGGLYLKDDYAASSHDSHPNEIFAQRVTKLLFNRIVDIIENRGEYTSLTGESK